jgi:hypothetical protein
MPVTEPTEAIAGDVDDQIPPVAASKNGVVAPSHTVEDPTIAGGIGVTVTT